MDTEPNSSDPTPSPSEPPEKRKLSFFRPRSRSYNPFEHRRVEKPSGDIRSLANLVKASLGSGILAMPLAFANSGWLVGIIGTLTIAFICGHCVHVFVFVSRECCRVEKKPLLGYAETCRSSFANGPDKFRRFAKAAFVVAEVSLVLTYLGVCCIYTVLIADSIKQIFDRYVFSASTAIEYYCMAITIPLCLMVQIKHLKWLAPFSLTANILLVGTFAICLYYIFAGDIMYTNKRMAGDLARFPAYLSTVIFAMEGIGVVMPVENAMKNPEHFLGCPSVLNIAMTVIAILYTVLGLFGYFRYGEVLRGSITLNLPIDDWPAIVGKIFIAISIFFTYPLSFYVAFDTLKRLYNPYISEKYQTIAEITIKIVTVCLCSKLLKLTSSATSFTKSEGCIGIALPMLEQIINIVGALFYSILGLIIPAIIETVFLWGDLGRFRWVLWKNLFLFSFGFLALISGCAVTVSDIVGSHN